MLDSTTKHIPTASDEIADRLRWLLHPGVILGAGKQLIAHALRKPV